MKILRRSVLRQPNVQQPFPRQTLWAGPLFALVLLAFLPACAYDGPEVWERPPAEASTGAPASAPDSAPDSDPGNTPAVPALMEESFRTRDGFALPLRSWLPEGDTAEAPKAVILALHGFNDYSFAFEEPGRYFAARGIVTYAYDQRSFGAGPHRGIWPGAENLIDDLRDAADLLAARHPGAPLYILGESMGGAVALAAAVQYDLPVRGLILSAPAVWARRTMPFYQRWALAVAVELFPAMIVTGKGLKIQASDNIEMLIGLGKDPLFIKKTRIDSLQGLVDLMSRGLDSGAELKLPALLLYGAKDEVIPWKPTARFWSALPAREDGQKTAYYDDGWHLLLRDLQARIVYDDILAWIENPAAALPSGADGAAARKLAEETLGQDGDGTARADGG